MSMRQWMSLILPVLLMAIPMASHGQANSLEQVSLHLKWHHSYQFAGFYAAQKQGYYAQAGLDVELLEGRPGQRALQSLLEGQVDYAVVDPRALIHYHRGSPVMAVAAIFQHDPSAIVVHPSEPPLTPADLVGKRIAVTLAGAPSLRVMFHNERVDLDAITTVAWRDPVEQFAQGEIDGFASYVSDLPWQLEQRGIDYQLIRPAHYGADFYGDILATTRQHYRQNPSQVAAMREASLRGWAWALDHPEQMIDYLLELESTRPDPLSREQLAFEFSRIKPLVRIAVTELGYMSPARWQRISQSMHRAGLIESTPRELDDFLWQHSSQRNPLESVMIMLSALLLLGLVSAAVIGTWNMQLKRQVHHKARELLAQTARREKTELAYRQLVENSVQGMIIQTAEQVIFVNRRFCRMLGYTQQEIMAMTPSELLERCVHPDDQTTVWQRLRGRFFGVDDNSHYVFRSLNRDGEVRYVEVFATAIEFENKTAVQSTFIDVSERVEAELGIQRRLRVERMLARQSAQLLQAPGPALGDHLQATLEQLVELIEASSGCLLRFPEGEPLLTAGNLRQLETLEQNTRRILDSTEPSGQARGLETDNWSSAVGVDSDLNYAVLVPLQRQQKTAAIIVLGFREKPSGLEEITYLLSMAGNTFSAALEHRDLTERLEHLANHDHLTGLPNRYRLHRELEQRIADTTRYGARLAVLLIDLDNFKLVNDSLGHSAGDQLLKDVANMLATPLRRDDFAARLGGDEFVLISSIRDDEDAVHLAEQLLQRMQQRLTLHGLQVQLSPSVGISLMPTDGASAEQLLQAADAAMYAAKAAGKGCYRFYSQHMNDEATERLTLESQLRQALDGQQLLLHFQPQVRLSDQSICGLEALVRWQHPERGLLAPGYFLSIAEQSGLIREIDDWVFRQACATALQLREQRLDWRLAVNLSARELHSPLYMQHLASQLAAMPEICPRLEIEITESMLMSDVTRVTEQLRQLKETAPGIRIAIDDFGSGYSSLNYLRSLPIDTLKIDRTFVTDLDNQAHRESTLAIVRTIIELGRNLGLAVLAEGIESAEQARLLAGIGCELGQGFYFARPAPLQQLLGDLGGE